MTVQTVTEVKKGIWCKLHHRKISASVNLSALSRVFSNLKGTSILGGNSAGRFSYWTAEPKEIFEFRSGQEKPFEKLAKTLDKCRLQMNIERELPKGIFVGGWIGYFSYELGRYIEKVPATTAADVSMPLIRLCFYDRAICYDDMEHCFWLIVLELDQDNEKPEEKFAGLEKILAKAKEVTITKPVDADVERIDFSQIRCNINKEYYLDAVEKIKRYIYDGDVYQVNFSQRFNCDFNAEPIELYHWQNQFNPSGYAAYIDGDDFHIVSASPEMFITINNRVISTKPIKGTRPRIKNSEKTNTKNYEELLGSEKEKAELNMIIDLERNDLGRICKYGTIKVIQPRTIESYPTVFHAVATVAGELRDEIGFCDILKAMFPGGSITGAPKISSMEIIDETEPTERGVYTGSIGFIGIDGSVSLNIAIRTIIISDEKAYAQVGGGIVADSSAEAEWTETITKGRALIAGINSVQRIAYSGQKKQKLK